jgi:lipopolysaccharide assembly outer membrane protein LptD (OstA)
MDKKKTLQISLIVLFILFCLIFYNKYFFSGVTYVDTQIDNEIDNEKNEIIKNENEKNNIIENLKYVSEDFFGNTYIITAESASFKKDLENQLELYIVNAKIIQNEEDVILIYSGLADYDKITNNTIFKENVKINYKDQELNSNIVKLNFSKNLIEILENVYYKNKNTEIYADKAEIDLLNKKMKISMINQKDKVKISGKY